VIDQARRQLVQVEIHRCVGPNDHGVRPGGECGYEPRQGVLIGVEVVGIELHSIAPTLRRIDGLVPAAANAQVGARRDEMHQACIRAGERREHCRGAIG
jgi:hypothetical protein